MSTDVMTNGGGFNMNLLEDIDTEPTKEFIEQLKADNHCEQLISCRVFGKRWWFRPLKPSEYQYAQDLIFNKKKLHEAMTYSTKQCCVHPATTELNLLVNQYPGVVMTMGTAVWEASGTVEAEVKKY